MYLTQQLKEIEAWQTARNLAQQVFQLTKVGKLAEDRQLSDELHHTSLKVMTVLAETTASDQKKKLLEQLAKANQYGIRLKILLHLVADLEYLPASLLLEMEKSTDELLNQINDYAETIRRRIRIGFVLIQL